jgi:hypothetical protein
MEEEGLAGSHNLQQCCRICDAVEVGPAERWRIRRPIAMLHLHEQGIWTRISSIPRRLSKQQFLCAFDSWAISLTHQLSTGLAEGLTNN